jgi:putative component of toxin-antitoxin plasmid stabilization module
VERLIAGNLGQHRNLTGGISELKIDVGPGYRVFEARTAISAAYGRRR